MNFVTLSVVIVCLWSGARAQDNSSGNGGSNQGSSNSMEYPRIPSNNNGGGASTNVPFNNNPTNGFQNPMNTFTNNLPNNINGGFNGQQQQPSGGIFSGLTNSVSSLFRPLVEVGPSRLSQQGRHIGVNVPLIYNLDMDTRGAPGQSRVSSNTMMGLVRVDRDRVRGPDGKLIGPVKVSLMGIPIYSNGQQAPAPGAPAGPNMSPFNGRGNTNNQQNGLPNNFQSNGMQNNNPAGQFNGNTNIQPNGLQNNAQPNGMGSQLQTNGLPTSPTQ